MTVIEFASNGHDSTLPIAEKRTRAREAYRADPTLKGDDLADRFGMSAEWGRKQKRAAQAELDARTAGGTAVSVRGTAGGAAGTPPPVPQPRAAVQARPRSVARGRSVAVRRVTAAAVTLVAVVAAVLSYSHMHDLALEAGEGDLAVILPLSVDGLVLAATMTLLSARRTRTPAGVLPWAALLLGLGASLAANVAAAEPTVVGRLVAAWPPVALAMSFELLLRQTRGER